MTIIAYRGNNDIDVRFDDGFVRKGVQYVHFRNEHITNPFKRNVYGMGYIGLGKYKSIESGTDTPQYKEWHRMLARCYSEKTHKDFPSYKKCCVDNSWLNFQNFASRYDENYYEIQGEKTELDKDILCKGNKVYCEGKCIFAPKRINCLFTKRNASRGEYPIGVSKSGNRFAAYCHNENGESKTIGRYSSPQEAFYAYKKYKESVIKRIAQQYRRLIPGRLYDALIRYEVDIDD